MFQFGKEIELQSDPKGILKKIVEELQANRAHIDNPSNPLKDLAALAEKPRNLAWQRLLQNTH